MTRDDTIQLIEGILKHRDEERKKVYSTLCFSINFGISKFDWDEFLKYCNTPCYSYRIDEPDEHSLL